MFLLLLFLISALKQSEERERAAVMKAAQLRESFESRPVRLAALHDSQKGEVLLRGDRHSTIFFDPQ